jgi:hypothetical protein
MDSSQFDALTKGLSALDSRRGAMRAFAVAGLGLGLVRLGGGEAAAQKKKSVGQKCSSKDQCKGDLLCRKSDSQNSCYPGPPEKRCCIAIGERCDSGCECCGVDVICNGHVCQKA